MAERDNSNRRFIGLISGGPESSATPRWLIDVIGNALFGTVNATAINAATVTTTGTISGPLAKVTTYNGITTAANGVPAIVGYSRLTGQLSTVPTVLAYTPAADASFEVSANVVPSDGTSYSFSVQLAYHDELDTARTVLMPFFNSTDAATGLLTTLANSDGVKSYQGIPIHIRTKANVAITISTTGTFTTCVYNIEAVLKQTA